MKKFFKELEKHVTSSYTHYKDDMWSASSVFDEEGASNFKKGVFWALDNLWQKITLQDKPEDETNIIVTYQSSQPTMFKDCGLSWEELAEKKDSYFLVIPKYED